MAYDAIFVDEGQDFLEEDFRLLKELCRVQPNHEPNIYVFYDDAQNFLGRKRPNWLSVGLNVRGRRAHVMSHCFRNTCPIVEAAFNVLYGSCANGEGEIPTKEFGDIALLEEKHAIARPLMLHIPTEDGFVPRETQSAMHAGLDDHPKVTLHDYEGLDHGFATETGKRRDEIVVMTADYSFLSYYPYYGFQGLTSHYANPLAQFDKRTAAIESWGKLTDADEFAAALDALPFEAPTAFLMRRGGAADSDGGYTLRLAEDVYPNQPNVRRYTVELDAGLFAAPHFTVQTIGPFVLAIRNRA